MTPAQLCADDGTVLPLNLDRWHGPPPPEELEVLSRARGPAIDLGCGPGRHVVALSERGVPAMGVDAAPAAAAEARSRGALVLERSIFDRIPGAGRWNTVLLLDGNIGIGGEPVALLDRAALLLAPRGIVLVELAAPGAPTRSMRVCLERGGTRTATFPWAVVGVDDVDRIAHAAGMRVEESWKGGERWFSQLTVVSRDGASESLLPSRVRCATNGPLHSLASHSVSRSRCASSPG